MGGVWKSLRAFLHVPCDSWSHWPRACTKCLLLWETASVPLNDTWFRRFQVVEEASLKLAFRSQQARATTNHPTHP